MRGNRVMGTVGWLDRHRGVYTFCLSSGCCVPELSIVEVEHGI